MFDFKMLKYKYIKEVYINKYMTEYLYYIYIV